MIKSIYIAICLLFAFSVIGFADNVSCYASLDDSNNIANLLTDLMRNDPAYDPYNEFAILRSGEREYRCYFGADLKNSSICYTYITQYMQAPAEIHRSIVSTPLNINKNGYWFVGNIDGSVASATADNYKTNAVLVIGLFCLILFVIFRIFRRPKENNKRGYRVK